MRYVLSHSISNAALIKCNHDDLYPNLSSLIVIGVCINSFNFDIFSALPNTIFPNAFLFIKLLSGNILTSSQNSFIIFSLVCTYMGSCNSHNISCHILSISIFLVGIPNEIQNFTSCSAVYDFHDQISHVIPIL
ncbi:MAG: hypothetical protein WCG25_03490 [bacterium]